MQTKKQHEGYLLIDHHESPGVSPDFIGQSGKDSPVVGPGASYESAVHICSHCNAMVVLNPLRTRERAWCAKCDRYVCDACGFLMLTQGCQNIDTLFDDLQEDALRRET